MSDDDFVVVVVLSLTTTVVSTLHEFEFVLNPLVHWH